MNALPFDFTTIPENLDSWKTQRQLFREQIWKLLGDMPPYFMPEAKITHIEQRDGYVVEHFTFDNGAKAIVPGYFLLPKHIKRPIPAILYHHVHGHKYALGKEDLFRENPTGIQPGVELVKAGFAVMAIDSYAFGEREFDGVSGKFNSGAETELALAKIFLWEGTSLWAMMLRDDILTLNYLLTRPEIDARRIGTTGMSMGGSHTTWLAALDERIAAVIPIAQMTRYRDFAATGNVNLHSIYYFVPGILKAGLEMEILTSLTAPRFQKILIGDNDPLSPITGVNTIVEFTRKIYALYDAASQFQAVIYDGIAHQFTTEMFNAMLDGFRAHLLTS